MSKKNRPKHQPFQTVKLAGQPPAPVALKEPTADQLRQTHDLEGKLRQLEREHGTPPALAPVESIGPTVAAALEQLRELVSLAAGQHALATSKAKEADELHRKAEEDRKTARSELAKARDDAKANRAKLQEEIKVERAQMEEEIAELLRSTNLELDGRRTTTMQLERDAAARLEAATNREQSLNERDAANRELEANLLERRTLLTQRELNAENGFLQERSRILLPLEDDVRRLREERSKLSDEISRAREDAENNARARSDERAERWAAEDTERTEQIALNRRELDEAFATERTEALDALREQLNQTRQEAEVSWEARRAAQQQVLDDRDTELTDRDRELAERERQLRTQQFELQTEQELVSDDRTSLQQKVNRLVAERTEALRHELESHALQLSDAREQRNSYFADLESRRELDRRFGDRTPEQILAALQAAERARDEYARELLERPDAGLAGRLKELDTERSALLDTVASLEAELAMKTGELNTRRLAAIELDSLRKQKEALETHKHLLDGAVSELRTRVEELTKKDDNANPMRSLAGLDLDSVLQTAATVSPPLSSETPSLKQFAVDLRHRIAKGLDGRTLYYSDRDIRSFLGGLAMGRLTLLQGISGTGKTSLPLAFARAVGGESEVIEVQAGWRDRQDLIGYYNAFHRHYYATNFLQALYAAGTPANRDRIFMMVLDEFNLSRPEQFFADFLSALEQPIGARRLTLVSDPIQNPPRLMVGGRHLPIPPNVWFVGTANHDESTAEFADKTYDRAHIMEMPRKTGNARFSVNEPSRRDAISYSGIEQLFNDAAKRNVKDAENAIQWLSKADFAVDLQNRFRVGWGNRLENQLSRYLPVVVEAGGSIGEAMDHLLATKVLRRLRDRHDIRPSSLEDLSVKIQTSWDQLDKTSSPERSIALLEAEITAKRSEDTP